MFNKALFSRELTMTVNKFGSHILSGTNGSYFCILPMILANTLKTIKLPNGEERRCYGINGGGTTLSFPLPESEVNKVDCNMDVEFVINNKLFTMNDLIGQRLISGDIISIVKPKRTLSNIYGTYLGLVLKSEVQNE